MEKRIRGIKRFFEEFKKFITRGNVLDMAVGVIVGGAFTGIVNGLSNYILKPLINWLLALVLGKEGLTGAVTMLSEVYMKDETGKVIYEVVNGKNVPVIDLASSIYIDWGAFISAIINFLLIAFTLFVIVRMINQISEAREKAIEEWNVTEKKAIVKIRREQKVSKAEAKRIYEEKVAAAAAAKAEEERLAAEAAAAQAAADAEKAMANTRLLEEIRDLLKNK